MSLFEFSDYACSIRFKEDSTGNWFENEKERKEIEIPIRMDALTKNATFRETALSIKLYLHASLI